jgi:DNA-binding CsgD family transcriptional regulator
MATLVAEGHAAAAPLLRRAASGFSGPEASVDEALKWGWFCTAASNALWDDDGLRATCARQLDIVRDTGALAGAQTHLTALGTLAARSGDFAECESLMAESAAMAEATGAQVAPYNQMLVLALKGSAAEAQALIEATIGRRDELQQGLAVTVARWAASLLYNGLGRFDDALEAATAAAATPNEPFAAVWSLPEVVEAAVRADAMGVARAAVKRLISTTQPSGTNFGLGVEARCRALVSQGDGAEMLYRSAIDRLVGTRMRAELARAHLLYGEWLRGEGRGTEARLQLRRAYDMFAGMGVGAFAERTRRELEAAGETVSRRAAHVEVHLTPQERQIAQLACEGLSNPEIGARLFLSARTVEWHLGKVFAKLGIQSRLELSTALPGTEPGPAGS